MNFPMAYAAMKMKVQPQYASSAEPLPVQISTTYGGVSQVEKILPGADRIQNGMPKKHFASRKRLYLIGLACV
jgi:hypothetical protein